MKTNLLKGFAALVNFLFGNNTKKAEEKSPITEATVQHTEQPAEPKELTHDKRCNLYDEAVGYYGDDKKRSEVLKSYSDEEVAKLVESLYKLTQLCSESNDERTNDRSRYYEDILSKTVKCLAEDPNASKERLTGVLQVLEKATNYYATRYGWMRDTIKERLEHC